MKKSNRIIVILIATNVITHISGIIKLNREKRRYKKLYDLTHYVIHVAEEQGVDISEFDLIALKAISEGNNATSS